jgi:hypothetical protein
MTLNEFLLKEKGKIKDNPGVCSKLEYKKQADYVKTLANFGLHELDIVKSSGDFTLAEICAHYNITAEDIIRADKDNILNLTHFVKSEKYFGSPFIPTEINCYTMESNEKNIQLWRIVAELIEDAQEFTEEEKAKQLDNYIDEMNNECFVYLVKLLLLKARKRGIHTSVFEFNTDAIGYCADEINRANGRLNRSKPQIDTEATWKNPFKAECNKPLGYDDFRQALDELKAKAEIYDVLISILEFRTKSNK